MGQTNRGGKPDGREEDGAGAGVLWQEFGGDPRGTAPVAGAAGGKGGAFPCRRTARPCARCCTR